MNIWIVNPYGSLPCEGWREYRSSMLATALAKKGHDIIWWISNFDHRSKTIRQSGWLNDPALTKSVRILSVPSSTYNRNISFARIKYEYNFGKKFLKFTKELQIPDVIVLADPSLFFSSQVVCYANRIHAKLVLDVLDLWPEQFQVALPKTLRPFGKLIFAPLYYRRKRLVNRADAVVAVSKDHLIAVSPFQSKPSLIAYLGLDIQDFHEKSQNKAPDSVVKFMQGSELSVIYSGTMGEAYDLHTLIEAVKSVIEKNNKIKFLFVGEGPYMGQINLLANQFPANVLCLGMMPAHSLPSIYQHCQIGVCSYSKGSTVTMPVKLYDYLAGGLFILYSITGEIDGLLSSGRCGIHYDSGDSKALSNLILKLSNNSNWMQFKKLSSELALNFDKNIQHDRFAELIESI